MVICQTCGAPIYRTRKEAREAANEQPTSDRAAE